MGRIALIAAALITMSLIVGARPVWACENCNEWYNDTEENPWLWPRDAMCCFSSTFNNNCDSYPCCAVKFDMDACWVDIVEDGYACGGTESFSCSSGGGGGGGGGAGGCEVEHGTLCPAECMSCTYFYY